MNNIFSNCGKIVPKTMYIHRIELENELLSRTTDLENYGSACVIGINRIGKSSFVYNSLYVNKEMYYEQGIIIIYSSLTDYEDINPQSFFKELVELTHDFLIDHNDPISDSLNRYYDNVKESTNSNFFFKIKAYFKSLHQKGKRVLFILDEFDHASNIFKKYKTGFDKIRTLGYESEFGVNFVLVSRRLIEEIEKNNGNSVLSGILGKPIYIKPFNEQEIISYWQRNGKHGFEISTKNKEIIKSVVGSHPYWLDLFMSYYVEKNNIGKSNDDIFKNANEYFFPEYQKILYLLKEQDLLYKLYQIVIGPPQKDLSSADYSKLRNYGLLDSNNVIFSKELLNYMNMIEIKIQYNFDSDWIKLERKLRELLKYKLKEKYGDNWETDSYNIYLRQPFLHKKVSEAMQLLKKMKKKKNLIKEEYRNSIIYIDFLTSGSLFDVYYTEWGLFQELFGGLQKNIFKEHAEQIVELRNMHGHSNEEIVYESKIDKGNAYVIEFYEKVCEIEKKLGQTF